MKAGAVQAYPAVARFPKMTRRRPIPDSVHPIEKFRQNLREKAGSTKAATRSIAARVSERILLSAHDSADR